MALDPRVKQEVVRWAELALAAVRRQFESGNQDAGFHLCFASMNVFLEVHISGIIGTVTESDRPKYEGHATEKMQRLFKNRFRHVTSWQSRDLSAEPKRYGGAARSMTLLCSVSGLKEHFDEAVVFAILVRMGAVPERDAMAAASEPTRFALKRLLLDLPRTLAA